MSSEYQVVSGIVQFDPKHGRQVSGQSVTDITIKSFTRGPDGEQPLIGITLWPEFAAVAQAVKKGDLIFADGKVKVDVTQDATGAQKQYIGLSPTSVGIVSGFVKPPQGVVQAPVAAAPVPVPVASPVAAVAIPVAAPVAVPPSAPAPF